MRFIVIRVLIAGLCIPFGMGFGQRAYAQSVLNSTSVGTTVLSNLNVMANNSTVMTLTTGGNVGVGTTTPKTTLDVEGGALTLGVATGTAPLVVTSTTPVANLTSVPTTYNTAGTQQTGAHMVIGSVSALTSGTTVNLTGSAQFTSAASYNCICQNNSNSGAGALVVNTNGTAFVVSASGATHIYSFICVGN